MIWYAMDPAQTAAHFGWPTRRIQAALNYYEAFPVDIDQAIEDSHAMTETVLKRLLPQMEVRTVREQKTETRAAKAVGLS